MKAFVFLQQLGKARPAGDIHALEGVQIDSNGFPGIFFEQNVDDFREFRFFRRGGELIHGALAVVFDAEFVQKRNEHFRLRFEEPELQQIHRNFVADFLPESVVNPGVTLRTRFSLDENWPQFPLIGQRGKRCLVGGFVLGEQVRKQLLVESRGHAAVNFVGFHGLGKNVGRKRWHKDQARPACSFANSRDLRYKNDSHV